MKLNCRPGDLAVIVGGIPTKNIGVIVTVVSFNQMKADFYRCHVWDVDGSAGVASVSDDCLRPIRDQPGADETLQWASVPREGVPA